MSLEHRFQLSPPQIKELRSMRRAALAALLCSCVATAATAQIVPPQNSKPVPTAKTDTIPAAHEVTMLVLAAAVAGRRLGMSCRATPASR